MKKSLYSKHGIRAVLILFTFLICSGIFAQKQFISGKGTKNFQNLKNSRIGHNGTQKPLLENQGMNPAVFLNKTDGKNKLFKYAGNNPDPLDSLSIYAELHACGNNFSFDTLHHSKNTAIMFTAAIMTSYPLDSSDILLTINFGDGTDTTFNPYHYYFLDSIYWDSTLFVGFLMHSYTSPGIYNPYCHIITSPGDSATIQMYYPISISADDPGPSAISSFNVYTSQVCTNDSVFYYGYNWGDSLVNFGTYYIMDLYYPNLQAFNDVFLVNIDFGDGSDTTFQYQFNEQAGYWYWWWWSYQCPPQFYLNYAMHQYVQAGTYNVLCTVTFPDGSTDTASATTQVADHCVTVGGKVFIDNNSNCIPDSNETGIPGVFINIPFGDSMIYNNSCYDYYYYYTVTDSFGNYRLSFPDICPMSDTIRFDPYYNFYPMINLPLSCPADGYYVFNTANPQLNYDFGFGCTSGYDLKGFLWGWRFRPGFQGFLYPNYGNHQCDSISGTAKLVIDNPGFLTIDSVYPAPSYYSGDTIVWDFNDISILDWWNFSEVFLTTDVNASLGDTFHTTLILEPINGDADPSDNIIEQDFIVSNSWDPNEKEVFPKGKQSEGYIDHDQVLTYVIHFQNTGSDTAYNIYISDTISPYMDLNSFKILTSSHYMEYSIYENIITFSFPNIMLPDSGKDMSGSQGFVSYRLKPKSNLPEATQITNTAYIYFDFNPAIITNTVLNTISYFTSLNETNHTKSIRLYPNPSRSELIIKMDSERAIGQVSLYDITGRKIFNELTESNSFRLNTSGIEDGVYILQIQNNGQIENCRVVIER